MEKRLEKEQRKLDRYKREDPRIEEYRVLPPLEGKLVRGRQGWLNHRISHGTYIRAPWTDHVSWTSLCGNTFLHDPIMVREEEADYVCGRCEEQAKKLGLPELRLIPEGGCEAIYSRHPGTGSIPRTP